MTSESESKQSGVAGSRRVVTVALILAMAVIALEQTVVTPAMPRIYASLTGRDAHAEQNLNMDDYAWVFSAYLLAMTITTPIYGKLADLWGRKRVLLFGLAGFGLGSMLSGLARTMPGLIAMRSIQGIGAGAVGPIVLTLLGDLYTLEERAKVQGFFSGVWGLAGLSGPALGGFLTDALSWRWVFFVSVPFGVIAGVVLAVSVREHVEPRVVKRIDWEGAALLALGTSLLLLAVLGETRRGGLLTMVLLGCALIVLVAFVRQEMRADDPILPPDLIMQPAIAAALVGNLIVGALMVCIDTFVPLYIQGVQGGSASSSGIAITPLFVSWSISVVIAAWIVVRMGFRASSVAGTLVIAAGTSCLVAGVMAPVHYKALFTIGMALVGFGMGPVALGYLLSVQNAVAWGRRGAATAAVVFSRTIGGSLGVGLLGAAFAFTIARHLAHSPGIDVASALRPSAQLHMPPDQLIAVRSALEMGLLGVFVVMCVIVLATLVCAWNLPAGRAVSRVGRLEERLAEEATAQAAIEV